MLGRGDLAEPPLCATGSSRDISDSYVPQVAVTDSRAFKNMLQVRIGSRHVWALLDSGANISVISDHLFQTLKSVFTKVQTPDFKQVSGVGGELHQGPVF